MITENIGYVAYKLNLPACSYIHPILHISQLKKSVSPSTEVSTLLLDYVVALYQVTEEVLILWMIKHNELMSWEDKEDL
jgi:hypothetical protein